MKPLAPIDRWTTALVEDAAAGRERIFHSDGAEVPMKLNRWEQGRFRSAKIIGFLVVHETDRRPHLVNVWGYHCEATRTPCVLLRRRRLYSAASMDLGTVPGVTCEPSGQVRHLSEWGVKEVLRALEAFGDCRNGAWGSCDGYAFHTRVPVRRDLELARRLLDLAAEHRARPWPVCPQVPAGEVARA